MNRRSKAVVARIAFAGLPGVVTGFVVGTLAGGTLGAIVGLLIAGFGWDLTRAVPERGEGVE